MANTLSDVMGLFHGRPSRDAAFGNVHSALYYTRARVLPVATDGIGRIYPMMRLLSQSRIVALQLRSTVIAGMSDVDIVLYPSADWNLTEPGPLNAIKNTVNLTLAVKEDELQALEVSGYLWEMAGVSSAPRPGTTYDLALLTNTDPAASGQIDVSVLYTAGA